MPYVTTIFPTNGWDRGSWARINCIYYFPFHCLTIFIILAVPRTCTRGMNYLMAANGVGNWVKRKLIRTETGWGSDWYGTRIDLWTSLWTVLLKNSKDISGFFLSTEYLSSSKSSVQFMDAKLIVNKVMDDICQFFVWVLKLPRKMTSPKEE